MSHSKKKKKVTKKQTSVSSAKKKAASQSTPETSQKNTVSNPSSGKPAAASKPSASKPVKPEKESKPKQYKSAERTKPISSDTDIKVNENTAALIHSPKPESISGSAIQKTAPETEEIHAISSGKVSAKTWIKNILKISVKMALLLLIIAVSWISLTPYFRIDRNKDGDYMRNLPDDTIDVLALGSSHMQYAFNPGVFMAETGYYSYVFGSVCQPFSESYYLLKEVLKTQHPDVVVIDVFTLLPQSQVCYADGTYYIAMDMMSGSNRLDASEGISEKVDEDTALGYKLDLYMNHGNWKSMDFSDIGSIVENGNAAEGYAWDLGYVAQAPEVFQYTPLQVLEPETVTALSESEKQWIDRMIDLCREEDIHLIFVKTPYIENQDDANKLAGIWEYLDYRQADYINFLEEAESLDWFLDMDGDTWHNNTWGAEIITKELARVIKENGYVKDHKDVSEVKNLYDEAMNRTSGYLMNPSNINIYRLMEEGTKYPCTILFRYKGSSRSSIGEYENNALQQLGFNHDFITERNKDYYAVIVNGKLIQESSQPFSLSLKDKTIDLTVSDILIDNVSVGSDGELQIVFCDNDFEWINPVGIDYASKYFWKNGCESWACESNP